MGLPFSNADFGLLWLLNDLYIQGYKPDPTVQDFLPFTYVRILLKDRTGLCAFLTDWQLNVEQTKSTSPLKIVKPTQSGFTVNDKSSWDVILEKGKTPVSLKMNERKVPVWSFLCILGYFQTYYTKVTILQAACTFQATGWCWSLVCIIA